MSVQESEERFRLLVSSVQDYAILMLDSDGRVVSWNEGAEHIKGYKAEEIIGQHFSRFYLPEDIQRGKPDHELKVAMTEGRLEDEGWRVRKDGSQFWANVIIAAVRDETGTLRGFSNVTRDVTKLKQAEDALRLSEARYHTLFDSIDEGFCIIEMIFDEQEKPVDYRFLEFNASFEKQTGLHDARGKRMRELAPQHEQHWFEIYGRIAMTGEAARFQNRAEQLHRWYDVYAFRFGEPKDRQVAILFNDITERKATEAKIVQLNAELQQQAAELEAANKELEAFSYSVSHDLRAPVRHVAGFIELLQKEAGPTLSEASRGYVATIQRSAKRMEQLIDDLLAFSRIGRSDMQRGAVNLDQLVKEVLAELPDEAKQRNIAWKIGVLPEVQADRSLLRQVLVNLISNAVKFTSTRPRAEIEIGCSPGNSQAVIFVRDNGAGFDQRYADKLFGVFQRLHRDDEFEGTGIGLANVQRIIHRHGGRVWAEGAVDGGATFYFSIPKPTEE